MMCGIAGQIDFHQSHNLTQQKEVYETMGKTLGRRGPDQEGMYLTPEVALVHRRLTVVDPVGGEQPMIYQEGESTFILVYNGELYNVPALRRELEGLGHTFTDRSDTQVLLHCYLQWGEDCVHHLNGIFAFGVWDERKGSLFLARDPIGVKPLFYALPYGHGLLFASEIKTLLAHPRIKPEIGEEGVAELLFMGPGRTPGQGVFRDILELPPAHCGHYTRAGLATWPYWQLTHKPHTQTFGETVEETRSLVLDAIRSQLVSDVPLCTFLSGGLDSSIISAVACETLKERGETLHTFSVDYVDNQQYFQGGKFQPEGDWKYIEAMHQAMGNVHHNVMLDSQGVAAALIQATKARDLPGMADVDSSLLLFCKEVKEHATVALSGECADEIFGGYPWYRDRDILEQHSFPWAQSTAHRTTLLAPHLRGRIDGEDYVQTRYLDTIKKAHVLPGTSPLERRQKEMMVLNFQWFMQTLLDRKDRMSMYNGLEVRVPFCDHRIAQYLYSVPWSMKDYQGREKGLLRHAMEGLLPQEVLWRKKSPYPKTHHPIYLEVVSAMLKEVIANPMAPIFQIVDKKELEQLLTYTSPTPWYGQLMTTPQTIAYFVQMNHWMIHYGVSLRL